MLKVGPSGNELKVPTEEFASERKRNSGGSTNPLESLNERQKCWQSPGAVTSSGTDENESHNARDIDYV